MEFHQDAEMLWRNRESESRVGVESARRGDAASGPRKRRGFARVMDQASES